MVILEGGALRRHDLAWAYTNSCAASGLAELDPPTCWDLCASGSPHASPRRELINPGTMRARRALVVDATQPPWL